MQSETQQKMILTVPLHTRFYRALLWAFHAVFQLFGVGVLVATGGLLWLHTDSGSEWLLATALEKVNQASPYPVTAHKLGHGWPFVISLSDLDVADTDGVFLHINTLRLSWNLLELLDDRLSIHSLSAEQVDLIRVPQAVAATTASSSSTLTLDISALEIGVLHVLQQPTDIGVRASVTGSTAAPVVTFSQLALAPYGLEVQGQLDLTDVAAPVGAFTYTLADLASVVPDASGQLSGQVSFTGRDIKLEGASQTLMYAGHKIEAAQLKTDFTLSEDMSAQGVVQLSATPDALPLSGESAYTLSNAGITLSNLKGQFPKGTLTGDVAVTWPARLVQGRVEVASSDLSVLSAFVQAPLAGQGKLVVAAQSAQGTQSGSATLDLQSFSYQNWRISRAALTVAPFTQLADMRWSLDMRAEAPVDLTAQANGALALGEAQRLRIATLTGQLDGHALKLQAPVVLEQAANGDLTLSRLQLRSGEARLDGEGSWRAGAVAASAQWSNVTVPQAEALGVSRGQITLSGTPEAPIISAQASFNPTRPRSGQFAARLKYQAGQSDVALSYSQGQTQLLTAQGIIQAPLSLRSLSPDMLQKATLTAQVKGRFPLDVLADQDFFAVDLPNGDLALDMAVSGPVLNPNMTGTATLSNGHYLEPVTGMELHTIAATISFSNQMATLSAFSADDGQGGKISGRGTASLSSLQLEMLVDHFKTLRVETAQAQTSANLKLAGAYSDGLTLSGDVTVHEAAFHIPDRLPVELVSLPVIERGHAPRQPRVRAGAAAAQPLPIALALTIKAPGRVKVEGRGVDAEVSGQFSVTGPSAAPDVVGQLDLVRGSYEFLGKRFTLTKGSINFDGGHLTDPTLNLTAEQQNGSQTVSVLVAGPVSAPEVSYSSNPSLPRDEIIARLLFGEELGKISPVQAVQLAAALASLNGSTGGLDLDVTGRLRRGLQLDQLDVVSTGSGTESSNALEVGKYLTDGVYLRTQQGLTPQSRSVGVEIRLSPQLSLQSETSGQGTSSLQIQLKKDY